MLSNSTKLIEVKQFMELSNHVNPITDIWASGNTTAQRDCSRFIIDEIISRVTADQ